MNEYWRVEIHQPLFLTLKPDAGEWSTLLPGNFTARQLYHLGKNAIESEAGWATVAVQTLRRRETSLAGTHTKILQFSKSWPVHNTEWDRDFLLLRQRATQIFVYWFAGRLWKNNSKFFT
jgi:hypothetical protein